MKLTLDPWQQDFIDTAGDKILCCGRQVGKSIICGQDAGKYSSENANKVILMIAPTERQAFALFDKTLSWLSDNCPKMIKKGKDRPTKTKINLTNGTRIWCLPTGVSGIGIRFLTVDRLYADEAAYIPEEVWTAITPMLLTTGGDSIYLSTPAGKGSHFADCVLNSDNAWKSFTRFSVDSETVVRERKICSTWNTFQRDKALEHLKRERSRMTALQYAQEYEGKLVDELRQFFPTDLIRSCMTLRRGSSSLHNLPPPGASNYLGVDVARLGGDEIVLASFQLFKSKLKQIGQEVTTHIRTTETVRRIQNANEKFRYKKIYIDDGGLGGGVFDQCLEDRRTKRKVVSINNASRGLDSDKEKGQKTPLLKEDLYQNLLTLMEQGKIQLFHDDDTFHSLKSIQAEYSDTGRLHIYGNYTHIAEALIRGAWCVRDKGLNIFFHSC